MNILETIKAKRQELDAAVNVAVETREKFLASVADVTGQRTSHRKRRLSDRARRKQSDADKARWKTAKKAGQNSL
jgi:hypothetical protein